MEKAELKRWANQMRVKEATGELPPKELVRKAAYRDLRSGAKGFSEEEIGRWIEKGLLEAEDLSARRIATFAIPEITKPITPVPSP